jgi:hypothetical protein
MMAAATKTWGRLARRFAGDGNPLRRRCDVIEGWLVPIGVAVFLALCPVAVAVTGLWVGAHNAATQRARASAHPVRAVLLDSAAGPQYRDHGANTWVVWTPARWTSDGHTESGDVPAAAGTRAGSTVTAWVNRAGRVEPRPLTAGEVRADAAAYTLPILAVLAALLAVLACLARKMLDRRRLAGWETAWLSVGPQWSRQR